MAYNLRLSRLNNLDSSKAVTDNFTPPKVDGKNALNKANNWKAKHLKITLNHEHVEEKIVTFPHSVKFSFYSKHG